jgi:hypothetical protein
VLFAGSYQVSQHVSITCAAPPDNLAWLRREFHPDTAEMARIQKLHENYLTECNSMCQMVAAKKQEVAAALSNTTNVSPIARQKLSELAACRAQCQSRMLQYFVDVSRNLPPVEGRRYLVEMQHLTLGLQESNQLSTSSPSGQ